MRAPVVSAEAHNPLHVAFLSIMDKIETHACICFRDIKCPAKKADRIAEVIGLCWRWFRRLAERNKDATQFPSALADFAVRAVRSGRRVCGQLRPNDVLSEVAQQNRGFTVEKLPDYSTLNGTPIEEALQDNTRSAVPDQVAFRIDLPAWRRTHTQRNRRIMDDLMMGERTQDVARKYRMSAGRISQLRYQFKRDWQRFVSDLPSVSEPAAASA